MLHPQARALLDGIEARGTVPMHRLTPTEARAAYRERCAAARPVAPEVGAALDLQAPGPAGPIPLRLYRPHHAPSMSPVLVFFHGGGFVVGGLDTHDTLCRELAHRSGCAVVSVDYRLAPEHPCPAAVDDALAATRWVAQHAAVLGVDAARVAVGGDSAGANLATLVAWRSRQAGDLPLAFQLLIYPCLDARRALASHARNGQGYLLTRDTLAYYYGHYLPDPAQVHDPMASPLLLPDLSGLPPALVLTAGHDPLRDEGLAYAQRLSEAGVPTSVVCFERQIHGFILMGRVLDEAHTAVDLCAAALARALA